MRADSDIQAWIQQIEAIARGAAANASKASANAFVQGGNSFGATATLGTKDANALSVLTNNAQFMAVSTGGATQLYSTNGITLSAANASGGPLPAVIAGALTLTGGAGGFALSAGANSTIGTSAGTIVVTSASDLGLNATGTGVGSLVAAAGGKIAVGTNVTAGGAGSVVIDSAAGIGIGGTNATGVTIGLSANCTAVNIGNAGTTTAFALVAQTLAITVPVGQIATTASAIAGGGAIPATLNYLICTINGTARKLPFAAT